DGAGDFQYPVVSAGAEVEVAHGKFQQLHGGLVQSAILFQFPASHPRVAGDLWLTPEPLLLSLARRNHPLSDLGGAFAVALAGDVLEFHGGPFDVQIDSVQPRTRDATKVTLDFARRAAGLRRHFPIWSRIHSGHEHELAWERHGPCSTGDSDAAFFEGLAHGLENAALELGQFVQEQNAVMRERD